MNNASSPDDTSELTLTRHDCADCKYRRAGVNLVAVVGALGVPSDVGESAMQSFFEDRKRSERDEIERKIADEDPYWDRPRPLANPYCVFSAQPGRSRILDIANASGYCEDFRAGDPPRHPCTTCQLLTDAPVAIIGHEAGAGSAVAEDYESVLERHNQSRARMELQDAIQNDGELSYEPTQLPTCSARSTPDKDKWVVGPVKNYSDACKLWIHHQEGSYDEH